MRGIDDIHQQEEDARYKVEEVVLAMLSLNLNLSDVIVRFAIKGPAYEPDDRDKEDGDFYWLKTDFSLHGRFLHYEMMDDELLLNFEVLNLQHGLEDLLNNSLKDDCTVGFAEPDLVFHLHPAKRLYDVPGKITYRDGYKDRALFAELQVRFWCREGGLGGNSFTMTMYRQDIEDLLVYLKIVNGELKEADASVQKMLSERKIIRS